MYLCLDLCLDLCSDLCLDLCLGLCLYLCVVIVFVFVFEFVFVFVVECFRSRFIFHFVLCLSPSLNDSCHKLSTFISSFRAGIIFFQMDILEFKYVHKSKYWNFIVKMQDKRQRNKLLLLANHAKTMNLDIIGWKNVTIVEYDLRERKESSWIMTPWLLYF